MAVLAIDPLKETGSILVEFFEVVGPSSSIHRLLVVIFKQKLVFDGCLEVLFFDAGLEVYDKSFTESPAKLFEMLNTEVNVFMVGATERTFEGKHIGDIQLLADD